MQSIAENKNKNKAVLFVDDEKVVLEVGSLMLQKLGYTVHKASNGNEAIEIIKKNRVDFIILDMWMPSMNGIEIYSHLKDINPNVKILLASGYMGDQPEKGLSSVGFDGYIQKPFDLKQLSKKIQKIFEN
jgi:CheY-like chemotaxis protein